MFAVLRSQQELSGLRFCVFGMGDRSYADSFCEAAKKIEDRMRELGCLESAISLHAIILCGRVEVLFAKTNNSYHNSPFKPGSHPYPNGS